MALFQSISDGVSSFMGDISDVWSGEGSGGKSGQGNFLSYPQSLGNNYNDALNYDSNKMYNLGERSVARADGVFEQEEASEPFIMFEFMRVFEPPVDQLAAFDEGISIMEKKYQGTGAPKLQGETQEQYVIRSKGYLEGRNNLQKTKELLEAKVGKRSINKTVALYMTPSISINDAMNYDQESRKTASILAEANQKPGKLDVVAGLTQEDLNVAGAEGGEAILGGFFAGIGHIGKNVPVIGKYLAMATGLAGYGLGGAVGDEALRLMGKSFNPNEYMQYKNTVLRSFSFNWKFLPDNEQESMDCADIIKIFRGAAHANRKSAVTLTVPDHVVVSFHGAAGFPAMPPLVLSNVGVTYNPNAASFFKQNNHPVEIDLNITLQEIMPIYRDDVEERGL